MKFAPFSDVILTVHLPEEGLKAGDVGTVVERHDVAGQDGGYSVEFFDKRGQTVAVATVPASALRLRPRLPLADLHSASAPPEKAGRANTIWMDSLLQLLAGVMGAVLGGTACHQVSEIYAWRLQNDWIWQHYTFWIYLFCSVGGLIVGVFVVGLFLMIYRGRWLQFLAGVIGAALGGLTCYEMAEIYGWRSGGYLEWQLLGTWIYLLCSVSGLIVGEVFMGLFLMIYRSSRLIAARRR